METIPPALIVVGAVLAFAAFWTFIVWLISKISGWKKLAEVYPSTQAWNATCWRFQSAILRGGSGYNNILKVCADTYGLHFSVIFPFSVGNTPFSVPWEEISGKPRQWLWTNSIELRFQRVPSIPFQISRRLADNVVAASGGMWQYE